MNATEAEKYFWLFEYQARARKLNDQLWPRGIDTWLASAPQCLDDLLLTEPFRDNLPANCLAEIDVVIESRDSALKKYLGEWFKTAAAKEAFAAVPAGFQSHHVFRSLSREAEMPFDPDKGKLFLISNWVVMNSIFKTDDGPVLVPGLAFHTDQSRADDLARQTKRAPISAGTIRRRWERLGLITVSEDKMPNLAAFPGVKMTLRPVRSKRRSTASDKLP